MLKDVLEDSTTYQWILKQGALRQTKKMLLLLGRDRFGEAAPTTVARIEAINDLDYVERRFDFLWTATTWQELLESS